MPVDAVAPTPTIEYAPRPPWHRRRRFRRLIYLVLVLATAIGCFRFGSTIWRHTVAMYSLRACLAHSSPGTHTVYDSAKNHLPGAKDISDVPAAWTRFQSAVLASPLPTDAVVFMHRMKSPSRHERLVAVVVLRPNVLSSFVFDLGSWHELPKRVTRPTRSITKTIQVHSDARYYAGEADPKDPSHFGFRMDTTDGVTMYDGRLSDDDELELTEHPVTPPKSPFWTTPKDKLVPEGI